MTFENEKRDFINEHLMSVEDVTENILKEIDNGEGIIITTEDGRVIDIDAVWSEDDKYEDCWSVRIYKSYEAFCDFEYYYDDSMRMKDLTINHIKTYMS